MLVPQPRGCRRLVAVDQQQIGPQREQVPQELNTRVWRKRRGAVGRRRKNDAVASQVGQHRIKRLGEKSVWRLGRKRPSRHSVSKAGNNTNGHAALSMPSRNEGHGSVGLSGDQACHNDVGVDDIELAHGRWLTSDRVIAGQRAHGILTLVLDHLCERSTCAFRLSAGDGHSSKVCPALSQRMSWRTSWSRFGVSSKRRISSMISPVSAGLVWVM